MDSFKRIDARMELLCNIMKGFSQKIITWTSEEHKSHATKLSTVISIIANNNKKKLCQYCGMLTTPIKERIEACDETVFDDKRYINFLENKFLGDTSDFSEFNFETIFATESQHTWTKEIHDEFWKNFQFMLKAYLSLAKEYPTDMPIYSLPN